MVWFYSYYTYVDEYSNEVEFKDNHVIWNRDTNRAYRFIHKENESDVEMIDQEYDDFYKDESTLFKQDLEDTDSYQTTYYMIPRLLTDKAV